MTALIVYGSNVASGTLSTADKLSNTTGGAEATVSITAPNTGTNNQYIELLSQGGSPAGATGSIPAPTAKGWLYDVTALELETIAAGNWSDIFNILIPVGVLTAVESTVRAYKRSSGGVYTLIGTIVVASVVPTGSKQQVTSGNSSLSSMAFASGDKLYIDRWLKSGTSPNLWTGNAITFYASNSGTAGVANDAQTTTPGFNATSGAKLRISDGYGGLFQ